MAAAGPILQMVGAGVAARNAASQGRAAKAAHDFNAFIEKQNAEIVREQTKAQVAQADREAYLRAGAIRAAAGKSGGKQAGSVLDILADNAAQSEIERQDIMYRGQLAERGHLNSAYIEQVTGQQAKQQAYMQASTELLSGAGKASSGYGRMGGGTTTSLTRT